MVEDKEIQDWLDNWDYRQYVRDALIEFNHGNGFFLLSIFLHVVADWAKRLFLAYRHCIQQIAEWNILARINRWKMFRLFM